MKGRTFRYMTEKPQYPFGFGLSYTAFRFDSITLTDPPAGAGYVVKASVKLSNIGKRDADNVVQIYVSKDKRAENDPIASLRDFRRVHIKAGKSVTVDFELPRSAFETVNAEGAAEYLPGSWTVIAGDAAPVPGVPVPIAKEKGAPSFVSAKISI